MKPVSDVHELFRRQRAIRSFTGEDVPDALVDQVLTAAIHGPSGSNTQPWHFIVIRDQAVKRAISEVYEEARADTYRDMVAHARQKGANAIIAVRYDATELMPGLTEVLCYGTAVVEPRGEVFLVERDEADDRRRGGDGRGGGIVHRARSTTTAVP